MWRRVVRHPIPETLQPREHEVSSTDEKIRRTKRGEQTVLCNGAYQGHKVVSKLNTEDPVSVALCMKPITHN